jgi:transcriptional regulator with XRE-family HTH domain
MTKQMNTRETVTVPQITREGRERLGKVLLYHRLKKNWSMDDLVNYIEEKTNYKIAKSTISALERGNQNPSFDTLAVICYSGAVPYSPYQLFDFASGQSIPREELDGYSDC